MDSTIYTHNGVWRQKGNSSDDKRTHAEIANFNGLKSPPANNIYGFIQGGAPCDACTEFFKKQSAGGKGFIFVIEKGGKGKKMGGTGYPILPGTIVVEKSEIFAKGSIDSSGKLTKPTFLVPDNLPAVLIFLENNCYYGAAPNENKITNKMIGDLVAQAS